MRALRFRKSSGCTLEVAVFSNGKVAACWQTPVPEVAIYDSLDQFVSVRRPDAGYRVTDNVHVDFRPESRFDGMTLDQLRLELGGREDSLRDYGSEVACVELTRDMCDLRRLIKEKENAGS